MKVGFIASAKEREWKLARAFVDGLDTHGIEGHIISAAPWMDLEGYDAIGMVGVKSVKAWRWCEALGVTPIMFDKGYVRDKAPGSWKYWRVSIGAHQPTRYLMDIDRPFDRFADLGLTVRPWKKAGSTIIYAGSSEKCHEFNGLPHPTRYAAKAIKKIRSQSKLRIIYRPKPSWHGAVPVGSAQFGRAGKITDYLKDAHALVTHSSNACFEAILYGVPVVVLGDAVAKPVASDSIANLIRPSRDQWLANLAYCQWTLDEFESGEAWSVMMEQMPNGL